MRIEIIAERPSYRYALRAVAKWWTPRDPGIMRCAVFAPRPEILEDIIALAQEPR